MMLNDTVSLMGSRNQGCNQVWLIYHHSQWHTGNLHSFHPWNSGFCRVNSSDPKWVPWKHNIGLLPENFEFLYQGPADKERGHPLGTGDWFWLPGEDRVAITQCWQGGYSQSCWIPLGPSLLISSVTIVNGKVENSGLRGVCWTVSSYPALKNMVSCHSLPLHQVLQLWTEVTVLAKAND